MAKTAKPFGTPRRCSQYSRGAQREERKTAKRNGLIIEDSGTHPGNDNNE